MLETLRIKNIAVIDETEIPFSKGLNILSGETGAGKSIIIEAISLLLGGRARVDLLRAGCDEATIEGLFETSGMPWIRERLARFGFDSAESSQLLIKRGVFRNGRNRIYVNGELATLSILRELCEGLVDLCGQHEHQSLMKSQVQFEMLDRFGGLEKQAESVATEFGHVRSLRSEFEMLKNSQEERARRADYLQYQIQEIQEAGFEPGEDEALQAEKKRLQSTQTRMELADLSQKLIDEDASGVLDGLRQVRSKFQSLLQCDDSTDELLLGVERAIGEMEEVSLSLGRYISSIELNPERLDVIQDRLANLAQLRRKYGDSLAEILNCLENFEKEYHSLTEVDVKIDGLQKELEDSEAHLFQKGKELSVSRKKVANLLAESVTSELRELKMPDSSFVIGLESHDDLSQWSAQSGADEIRYLVKTNRGEDLKELGKIASGGELSRIMLAIRRVISDKGGIGVYLFDEIDAGIGGQTAFEVGRKLKDVAQHHQVICITHIPQVAAFGDHHLSVRKETKGKRTVTDVIVVEEKQRQEEIARMLGGPEPTKNSIKNAAELMELAR